MKRKKNKSLPYVIATLFLCFFMFYFVVQDKKSTELHVFLESYATNPALSQMIEFSKLPHQTRKIIAWHRFPNRGKYIDLEKYNTREVHLLEREGYWYKSTQKVLKALLEEINKNPKAKVHLHLNMWKMDTTIRPFLEAIPKEKIALLHLYEDGYGELFKRELWIEKNQEHYSKEIIEKGIKGEIK